MYLTQQEIAQTRNYTLNNLLGLSAACLSASQRLAELFSSSGRDALYSGSKHFAQFGHGQLEALTQFPATLWLEHSARTSKLLGNAYEIVGETHKMLVHGAEAQVRVLDEVACSSLKRLERSSPREAEIAIQAVRSTLETAEQAMHDVNAVVIGNCEASQTELQPTDENLTENTPNKNKPGSRSRSKAN
jgi:hypothetical protein